MTIVVAAVASMPPSLIGYLLSVSLFSLLVFSSQVNQMATSDDPALPLGVLLAGLVIFLVMAVDYLWMIWDPHKQTLHDKMAGTFVTIAGVRQ